jgi:hypothetical protein
MIPIAYLDASVPILLVIAGVAAFVLRFNGPASRAHLALFRRADIAPRGLRMGLRMLWVIAAAAVLVLAVVSLVRAIA